MVTTKLFWYQFQKKELFGCDRSSSSRKSVFNVYKSSYYSAIDHCSLSGLPLFVCRFLAKCREQFFIFRRNFCLIDKSALWRFQMIIETGITGWFSQSHWRLLRNQIWIIQFHSVSLCEFNLHSILLFLKVVLYGKIYIISYNFFDYFENRKKKASENILLIYIKITFLNLVRMIYKTYSFFGDRLTT